MEAAYEQIEKEEAFHFPSAFTEEAKRLIQAEIDRQNGGVVMDERRCANCRWHKENFQSNTCFKLGEQANYRSLDRPNIRPWVQIGWLEEMVCDLHKREGEE